MKINYDTNGLKNLSHLYPKRVNIQYNWNGPYGHPWGFGELSLYPHSGKEVVVLLQKMEEDYNKTSNHEAWLEVDVEAIF